ncbi:Nascent polypeptide-associated complex protein [Candidatus Pacearchaeota archaeon]|nr:Nascent polypeptide-associated complex protein [Candidatus Pacearchaeota archaeon]
MFSGLNPKKMQEVMKRMGMAQEEISASRVVIEKEDSSKIIINNPSVTKISIQGKESFQIAGDIEESNKESSLEEDIKTIVEKTGSTKKEAKEALEDSDGDLAEAILKLSEK